jgi:hypothetical protein
LFEVSLVLPENRIHQFILGRRDAGRNCAEGQV